MEPSLFSFLRSKLNSLIQKTRKDIIIRATLESGIKRILKISTPHKIYRIDKRTTLVYTSYVLNGAETRIEGDAEKTQKHWFVEEEVLLLKHY